MGVKAILHGSKNYTTWGVKAILYGSKYYSIWGVKTILHGELKLYYMGSNNYTSRRVKKNLYYTGE